MIYLELFWAFFQVGLFAFGGGYAAMPLIQAQVIDTHAWMSVAEFNDLITISQMTPGPIAINCASFIGARLGGIPGAIVATLGNIAPACVIVMLLAWLYRKYSSLSVINGALRGLRPAVVGMIASAAVTMIGESWFAETAASVGGVDLLAVGLFVAAFVVLRKWKPNPILVMSGAGVLGLVGYWVLGVVR